jgi:hypothetical protein
VVTKPHERFQLQQGGGGGGRSGLGSSTPEVLSTSPESPYRLTQQGQEMGGDGCLPVVVRENPLFYQRLVELHQFQLDMGVTQLLTQQREKRTTTTQGQRVRALGMTLHILLHSLF